MQRCNCYDVKPLVESLNGLLVADLTGEELTSAS